MNSKGISNSAENPKSFCSKLNRKVASFLNNDTSTIIPDEIVKLGCADEKSQSSSNGSKNLNGLHITDNLPTKSTNGITQISESFFIGDGSSAYDANFLSMN